MRYSTVVIALDLSYPSFFLDCAVYLSCRILLTASFFSVIYSVATQLKISPLAFMDLILLYLVLLDISARETVSRGRDNPCESIVHV